MSNIDDWFTDALTDSTDRLDKRRRQREAERQRREKVKAEGLAILEGMFDHLDKTTNAHTADLTDNLREDNNR